MYQLDHTKYLDDAELESLKETLRKFRYRDPRNVLLLELALATGARSCELLTVSERDLIAASLAVHIRGAKGSNDREIPLPKELFAGLRGLEPKDGLIFPIATRRLRAIWDIYRPNRSKGFHSLRHTFAIRLYERTRDLRLVQVALGHRNIANTMIYADYVYKTKELRRLLVGGDTS